MKGVTVTIDCAPAPVQIRPYASGDEQAIRHLFHAVFGREMALSYWAWRYAHGPAGNATVLLAWDGPVLAGHYALVPIELEADGQRVRSGHSVDTMTHADYRGMGLFPRLARAAYERARDDGITFVWGFPNGSSHRGFIEALGWQDFTQIPTLVARSTAVAPIPITQSVHPAEGVDARYDDLWARVAPPDRVAVRRSADYVRWRFFENPRDSYDVLECTDGGRLLGYAATKPYQGQMQIVDLVFGELEVGLALCATVALVARSRGVESVGLWLDVAAPLHRRLEAWGFQLHGPVTYLAGRDLTPSSACAAMGSGAWQSAMSDSDVY